MKQAILAAMILIPVSAQADIYKCNGRWTNKQCDGASPESLRPISRAGVSQPSPTRAMLATPPSTTDTGCKTTSGGQQVRLTTISLQAERDGIGQIMHLKGIAKNESAKPLFSPLSVHVEIQGSPDTAETYEVAPSMPAQRALPFDIEISRGKLFEAERGTYNVSLRYENQGICDQQSVAANSGSLSGLNRGFLTVMDTTESTGFQYEQQVLKQISNLEKAIEKLKAKYTAVERSEDRRFHAEANNLHAQVSNVCGQSKFFRSNRLDTGCMELVRAIGNLD